MADGAAVTICGRTQETLEGAVAELGATDNGATAAFAVVDATVTWFATCR